MTSPAPMTNPSAERIPHLLAVAKTTFGDKGFAATTMDDIAGAAGMSKKTLYKLFDSKSDLFRAMLTANLQRFAFLDAPQTHASAIEDLRRALRKIADIVLAPDEIALHRLLIAERRQSPALATIFSEVIFNSGSEGIITCVRRVQLKPALRDTPIQTVADMMLGAVFSNDHFRLMVDGSYRINRRALNKRIDIVIATFCEDAPNP
ncbi:TetR/AcrR family transcriptional regulator [Rhodopseudomonas boonkerdii]|uniref:TetR/AcrR family transcriptional regulator n=1 Tax=Rhodopseudomonas boonkerdii TaxID=475937 RepID=UPI001E33A91E|nr:TetR/AcrR family transcriptional regulator [Rhodopseudomonas boonkerdii]